MLLPSESDHICKHAYVPEHLFEYVVAISELEPFLFEDYVCYYLEGHLIFIGYPLRKPFEEEKARKVLNAVIERFKPNDVAVIGQAILTSKRNCYQKTSDYYYRLDLAKLNIYGKLKYTLEHASSMLYVEKKQEVTNEHTEIIDEFLSSRKFDPFTQHIFSRIPYYVSKSKTAWVFSARNKNKELIAFDIADFGSKDYAFYMFNFLSRKNYVPGASDFLLFELINEAKEKDKIYLNLGLGINEGVRFFKKKWGGVPFLKYEFFHCFQEIMPESLLKKL